MSKTSNDSISVHYDHLIKNATDNQLKQKLDSLLNEKKGSCSIYKVGITNNPEMRKNGHRHRTWITNPQFLETLGCKASDHAQAQPWKEMQVLYESSDYQRIQAVEDLLVQKHLATSGKSGMVCWNERAGGAGRIPKESPYYVYVLLG